MPYGYGYFGFKYVSVAEKRANALKKIKELRKKNKDIKPIESFTDKKIAHSFWGQSWCDNMEQYADYENRLPRGRAYIRHGCICDLQISEGLVTALVNGTSLYKISIKIDKLTDRRAELLQELLQGKISSQLELLQGKIPEEVKELVGNPDNGIIPFPKEIHMHCSCPDSASLCKHIAAVLYGIGRRLDTDPGVLFTLRGLDPKLLCASTDTLDLSVGDSAENLNGDEDLSALFGIELGSMDDVSTAPGKNLVGEEPVQTGSAQSTVEAVAKSASSQKSTGTKASGKKASTKKSAQKPAKAPARKAATRKVEETVETPEEGGKAKVAPKTRGTGTRKASTTSARKSASGAVEKASSTRKKAGAASTKEATAERMAGKDSGETGGSTLSGKVAKTAGSKDKPPMGDKSVPVLSGQKDIKGLDAVPVPEEERAPEVAPAPEAAEVAANTGDGPAVQAVATGNDVTGPFDATNPTAEGLLALCEFAGRTPQEASYLMGVGYQTFKSWLAQKGRLSLKSGSLSKIEKYQQKVLKARARDGK